MNKSQTYIAEEFLADKTQDYIQIGGKEEPYIASRGLIEAINLAILLQKPLLLKGEPGCGKTRFAKAVAYELYQSDKVNYRNHFVEWHIKSTTKAKDGLYTFDFVDRLRDAQIFGQLDKDQKKEVLNPETYVRYGPLGRAFYVDQEGIEKENQVPKVVLIDEIDKADIDFPNDLLLELDEMRFTIDEVKVKNAAGQYQRKTITAPLHAKPIIIITSNDEKALPDAFLRRCLFYYINFPNPKQLEDIVKAHFIQSAPEKIKAAIETFYHLRDVMAGDESSGKKVSTSELIDWFRVMEARPGDWEIEQLKDLTFSSVLIKSFQDHKKYLIQKEHQKKPSKKYLS